MTSKANTFTDKAVSKKPVSKKRAWLKFVSFLIVLFIAFLTGGFLTFAQHVDKLTPPQEPPKADGIVVWTGKGGGRLESGGRLLEKAKGERVLISGVNAKTDMAAIQALMKIDDKLAACCIDLDYAATNTLGNARETASWASSLGYEHIILVTSAYHMPRAQVEIGAAELSTSSRRMRITPYPVRRTDDTKWYSNPARFKRVAQEYGKLLLSYSRGRNDKTQPPVLPPIETK